MKKYYIFLLVLLFSFNLSANNTVFIDGFEDIPLCSNMLQMTDSNLTFNNEETGYIETNLIANKNMSFNEFKYFYIKTLPELGWNLFQHTDNNIIFHRENNVLEFQKIKNTPLKVSISLKK